MCCGGRNRPKTSSVKSKKVSVSSLNNLPGKDGMVILEYNGLNSGDETWVGPYTGQVYVLGGIKKRGYVDKNDAGARPTVNSDGTGMLSWRENSRYIFNLYTPPAVNEIIEPEPQSIVDSLEESEEEFAMEAARVEVEVKLSFDVNEMTVADIKKAVASGLSDETLLDALETEQAGKNRKSVIALLENELA